MNTNPKRRYRIKHQDVQVNVAPLVDVMLVLVIIFMITAPILNVGVNVDLPKTKAASLSEQKNAPIVISIDKDSKIYVEEANITLEDLIKKLPTILENGKSDTIYVRGDKDLQYGTIMKIMGIIASSGACKVSLVSEQDTSASNNVPVMPAKKTSGKGSESKTKPIARDQKPAAKPQSDTAPKTPEKGNLKKRAAR